MTKKLNGYKFIAILVLGIVLIFSQVSLASMYTAVYLDCDNLTDIAALQFEIVEPVDADVSAFTTSLPGGWINLSTGKIFGAFDGSGSASLSPGIIGTFDRENVMLDGWVLSNQSSEVLVEGIDYLIAQGPDGYHIRCPSVPIPGAFILLGSGLFGLLAIRRRRT